MTGFALPYTTLSIDRAAALRRDPDRLRALLNGPERRILPVWRNRHAVDSDGGLLTLPDVGDWPCVFLGLVGETPWFATDLSPLDDPPALGGDWRDLREIGPIIAADDGALMGYARGLLGWHRRHRFCPVCGAATESLEGGHLRLCTDTACATPQFPRTDPAVIMLITDPAGRALLGRQTAWPGGMLSTLAGFVEPGETLEQAVAREVHEEAGIIVPVDSVRYVASQPWPFPSSLMLAFEARAISTDITIDHEELEDAAWFDRRTVATFRETADDGDGPALPRHDSVARFLINRWLQG